MRHFREFMAEDIGHLEACLSAARKSASTIRNLRFRPDPITENQIRKHKDVELEFDIQLTHIRDYLNGMWAEDEATEDDGPPEAIDEVGEGPRRIRISLEANNLETIKKLAGLLAENAELAYEDPALDIKEAESAAEALFLFLRNRVK